MKCEEIREVMPDLASGLMETTPEISDHLVGCAACTGKMEKFRQTMALLDEWKAPEPAGVCTGPQTACSRRRRGAGTPPE
ncbi:MAG: hypothetical protein WB799_08345, partial [Candidatus Sulfotelmatobacter sp.]